MKEHAHDKDQPQAAQPTQALHYRLPKPAYEELEILRDQLRGLADYTASELRKRLKLSVSRNGLAHCFDHLADRVNKVLHVCEPVSGTARRSD